MNIDKAIRKQKKSYKRFMLTMSFIFFIMPIVIIVTEKFQVFYVLYMIFIEMLVLLAIFIKVNNEHLKFWYDNYRLKIKCGAIRERMSIDCNKVVFVHARNLVRKLGDSKDFVIILIVASRSRSKTLLPINIKFLKMYPYAAFYYNKLKQQYPEENYSFTIIKKGGFSKYELLDNIYKRCVYAYFTAETIEKIKKYRNSLNDK